MKNKRGITEVITTIIIIGITITAISIVWYSISNLTNKQLNQATSCLETMDKIHLDDTKTCYDKDSKVLGALISVDEIEIEGILIGVTYGDISKSFELKKDTSLIFLGKRADDGTNIDYNIPLSPPGNKSGVKYYMDLNKWGFNTNSLKNIKIELKSIANGEICENGDSIFSVSLCE